jgi:cytochrome c
MKGLMIAAAIMVASAASTNAQDIAAGATSFKKCVSCHDLGPTAKNKLGPVLNPEVGNGGGIQLFRRK